MILLVNPWGEQMIVPRMLEESLGRELLAAGWRIKRILS